MAATRRAGVLAVAVLLEGAEDLHVCSRSFAEVHRGMAALLHQSGVLAPLPRLSHDVTSAAGVARQRAVHVARQQGWTHQRHVYGVAVGPQLAHVAGVDGVARLVMRAESPLDGSALQVAAPPTPLRPLLERLLQRPLEDGAAVVVERSGAVVEVDSAMGSRPQQLLLPGSFNPVRALLCRCRRDTNAAAAARRPRGAAGDGAAALRRGAAAGGGRRQRGQGPRAVGGAAAATATGCGLVRHRRLYRAYLR